MRITIKCKTIIIITTPLQFFLNINDPRIQMQLFTFAPNVSTESAFTLILVPISFFPGRQAPAVAAVLSCCIAAAPCGWRVPPCRQGRPESGYAAQVWFCASRPGGGLVQSTVGDTGRSVDWSIKWLTDQIKGWLIDLKVDWSIYWLINRFNGWLIYLFVD